MNLSKKLFQSVMVTILLSALCISGMFINVAYADTVYTVPENEYTVSGSAAYTITGIKSAWLDSLTTDADGNVRISVEIPQTIGGINVTGIGANAFWTNRTPSGGSAAYSAYTNLRITNLDLSSATNLTSIGGNAFYNQSGQLYSELNVANFVLPDTINSIGASAFSRLTGLKGALVMPNNLTAISTASVFNGCTGFTSLDLNNVTTITGGSSFSGCSGLKSIDLGVIQVLTGSSAFYNCTGLEGTLTIPNTLNNLGAVLSSPSTFYGSGTASSGFTLQFQPNTQLVSIPSQCFYGAKVIGHLTIPEGITEIGTNAFGGTKIESLTLPKSIKTLYGTAFGNTDTLAEINFPQSLSHGDGLRIYNAVFQYGIYKVIVIPEYVTGLGSQCFYSRNNTLTTVYLNADPAIPFNTGSGSNSPFQGMQNNTTAVIIAKDATDYAAWNNKAVTGAFKAHLTYEMDVEFCDPTTDLPIATLSPLRKLYNRSITYEKNALTGEWLQNPAYSMPAIPSTYLTALGWSLTPNGSIFKPGYNFLVTSSKLYPAEGVTHEYIWFGQYQQTCLIGVTSDSDPALAGLVEGVDYIKEARNPGVDEYYKIEPVRWRILEQNGNQYILISEAILDSRIFTNATTGQTTRWATSDIRAWLNSTGSYSSSGFYAKAFSNDEMTLIDDTVLTDVSTTDKIYLLDYDTSIDTNYFADRLDLFPEYKNNTYGQLKMNVISFGTSYYGYWWLRTFTADIPGHGTYLYPLAVNRDADNQAAIYANSVGVGIRPMLTITLGNDNILTHAGTYNDPYVIDSMAGEAIVGVLSASPAEVNAAGDTITYTYVVTNTGNFTLTDIAVTVDGFTGDGPVPNIVLPVSSLAAGASTTATVTYTVTNTDLNAANISFSVHASAKTAINSSIVDAGSTATVLVRSMAGEAIVGVLSASPAEVSAAGNIITYTYVVTNTGNFTLTDIAVTVDNFTGDGPVPNIVLPVSSLAAGASTTATVTYTVTNTDLNAANISFSVHASANTAANTPIVSVDSTATVVIKTNSGGGGGDGGSTIPDDDDTNTDDPDSEVNTGLEGKLNTKNHIRYINGYDTGEVKPLNNITRAEVAQIFYNLLLDKTVNGTTTFSDVKQGAWYYTSVNTLASMNVIKGYEDGSYRPNAYITRAEFTAMAVRFATPTISDSSYGDVPKSHWAYGEISTAQYYGWIHGYPNGLFMPDKYISRAEVVTLVNKMLERSADQDFIDTHMAELTQFTDLVDNSLWFYYDIFEAANEHLHKHDDTGAEIWQKSN